VLREDAMKILFATARNPRFPTITEYVERAFRSLGHELAGFDDRRFVFPGRVRRRFPALEQFDHRFLNRRLVQAVRQLKPDLLLCAGGERLAPATVEASRLAGVRTALWTIDTVKPCDPRTTLAPHFDFVFCGGTEMVEALRGTTLRNGPHWLPFACDPELHRPVEVSSDERRLYGCDIAFVGSLHPKAYANRLAALQALADFDIGIWGPGASELPASSPIRQKVRGDGIGPAAWTRIYSAARIVVCAHYDGPGPPSLQASPRVYEVLACGGFLLCDDRRDVRALFEDGRDLSIYRDLNDLRGKVHYYLTHERERCQIAARGRTTVLAAHSYRHRVATLTATVAGSI
jgi:spore maturation protein CgeB